MRNFPNFEDPGKIYHSFQPFSIDTHQFIKRSENKYVGGVPLMYEPNTRTLVVDPKDTHTIVYGATGSLKSRSVVMPTIRILGVAGESMIVNDSKGELYAKLARELEKQGYNIIVINLRDSTLGNSWNPLYLPFKFYIEGNMDNAAEFTNDIANTLMKGLDASQTDPFWDNSSADVFVGLTMLLFKYVKEHNLDQSVVNIGNIIELRRLIFSNSVSPQKSPLWIYGKSDDMILHHLSGAIYAPNDTRSSILSVFDQKMGSFTIKGSLLDMISYNDIDIAKISEQKSAVFLITPDEKTTYHRLVTIFIKQSYEYLIYTAQLNNSNTVANRINYILDEFSSLPAISDMPTMISAARSRDIRFLLVVQSKHSLKKMYGMEADTIISNCGNWIFLTSREIELLKELSELCGERANRLPNVSIFDLQHLSKEKNEAIVLCGRLKPSLVSLLDIDKFQWEKEDYLPMDNKKHSNWKRCQFSLKPEIEQKVLDDLNELPQERQTNRKLSENSDKHDNNDLSELIDNIKARIALIETNDKSSDMSFDCRHDHDEYNSSPTNENHDSTSFFNMLQMIDDKIESLDNDKA